MRQPTYGPWWFDHSAPWYIRAICAVLGHDIVNYGHPRMQDCRRCRAFRKQSL